MYYFKVKRVKTNHIFMESTPPTVAVCRRQLLSFRGMSSYHAVIGMSSLLENVDERTDLRGRYRPIGPSSVKAIWREGENNLFVISAPSWYEHKTQTGRVDPGYLHLSLFDFKGQKLLKGSNFSLFIPKRWLLFSVRNGMHSFAATSIAQQHQQGRHKLWSGLAWLNYKVL